jgi:F-type H+-transporting ATPase subunit b
MDLITPGIGLIFWTSLVFLTLVVLLKKFAWGPILKALDSREESIQNALDAADLAKAEMEELQQSNQKLLDDAKAERANLIDEARSTGREIVDEAKGKASVEASLLIEKAQVAIENEKKSALAEIQTLAATLSVGIAEKLIKKELSDKAAQEQLIDSYIKEANISL